MRKLTVFGIPTALLLFYALAGAGFQDVSFGTVGAAVYNGGLQTTVYALRLQTENPK